MHLRVQGLDPAVHISGNPGDSKHRLPSIPRRQSPGGAAGGAPDRCRGSERAREFDEPGLSETDNNARVTRRGWSVMRVSWVASRRVHGLSAMKPANAVCGNLRSLQGGGRAIIHYSGSGSRRALRRAVVAEAEAVERDEARHWGPAANPAEITIWAVRRGPSFPPETRCLPGRPCRPATRRSRRRGSGAPASRRGRR